MRIQFRGRPCNRCPKEINQKRPNGSLVTLNSNLIGSYISCKVSMANKILNSHYTTGSTTRIFLTNMTKIDSPCNSYMPLNTFARNGGVSFGCLKIK